MPVEFSAVLVKGRGNYVSLRRLDTALARAASLFNEDEQFDELRRIAAWAKESDDGSLADLDFRPHPAVWDEVASDHGNCMGRSCPHYKDCFYYHARRRVATPKSWSSIMPCSSPTWPCGARASASCPSTRSWSSTKPTRSKRSPATTWAFRSATGRSSSRLRRLYNERTNRGLLVHHHLREAQKLAWECRDRADRFFGDVAGWLDEQEGGNGRVRKPKIVANALSEGLSALAAVVRRDAKKIEKRREEAGPRRRRQSARRTGPGRRAMALPAARRGRLLDRVHDGSPAAPDRIAGRPAGPGTDPPRRTLHQGPQGDYDQRHAGHRPGGSISSSRASACCRPIRFAWAARSTTGGRPN